MSKFLAIFIAAVLILSLFLTVYSLGDKYESGDPNTSTSTTATASDTSAPSTSAPTTVIPDSGVEADIFIDSTGKYGYSVVGSTAFFFVKLNYSDVDFTPMAVYFEAQSCTAQGVTVSPNVRVSFDAKIWNIPYDSDGSVGYEHTSILQSSVYVSYCVIDLAEDDDVLEWFGFMKEFVLTNESYFKVSLSPAVGSPSETLPE